MAFDLILEFTKGLLDEAGFSTLPPEELKDYQDKVVALLSQKLGMEMMKLLKEKDLDDYFDLLDKEPSPQELFDFFSAHIENLDDKVIGILKSFRREFLQNVADSQNMATNK
jgi:type I site-specific restriction-modification system R (restriction) subunit